MANTNVASDMAQFFDFGEAAMPEVSQQPSGQLLATEHHLPGCPAEGQDGNEGCLCHAFDEDLDLPEHIPADGNVVEEFNTDFSSWLPRYQKPAQPCDYCRSRGLECFALIVDGKSSGCSPCNALFRPCSFNSPEKMPMQKSKTSLDTLDVVTENNEHLFGGLTGKKPMRCLGHMGPIEDEGPTDKPKKGAAAARFPRAAIKILKDWMIEHIDHPYPTDEEKESLKQQTGLTLSQISNWMANTRRRQKARPKRSASPSIRPSTEAINIPPGRTWESLNPFERWKHSPPENEPAPMTAIVRAMESFDPPEPLSSSSSYRKEHSNDSTGSFSVFRAPSTASLETGLTGISSGTTGSHNSAYSHGSKHSFGSMNSLKSKERRRRRRIPTRTPKHSLDEGPRLFQCTFCTDRFKSKYDWSRHEKSLHLSLEKWICAPLGDVITCSASGQKKCVYCDAIDPSKEHLETHNHRLCEEKGMEARTFYRKDHLRQHLRLMHGCKMLPSMESWKSEAQYIRSRCGFCGMTFDKWQDRVDHLAKEFRNGATMKDWKGCRGLDPHVAVHVTNAMPPYLIANESRSPFPFSATNSSSMKQGSLQLQHTDLESLLPGDNCSKMSGVYIPPSAYLGGVGMSSSSTTSPRGPNNTPQTGTSSVTESPNNNPAATCWEILTLRLGRFARRHVEQNGPNTVTDAMLQRQARLILYGEDDPWHQTAADNPEWLNLFKKAHGIDDTLPLPGVASQHEIFEDLGVRSFARLDQSFNIENFDTVRLNSNDPTIRSAAFECALTGSMNMLQAGQGTVPSSLPELTTSTTTTSGASNLPVTTFAELQGLNAPIPELECTDAPGGLCIGEDGELGLATAQGTCARSTSAQELATIKALDSFITPISEGQTDFSFQAWDTMGDDFNITSTTAGLSHSVPVTSSFSNLPTSGSEVIHGDMGNPQVMRWDDHELGFNLDMDLDLDNSVDILNLMGAN